MSATGGSMGPKNRSVPVSRRLLVVGVDPAGVRLALELADAGVPVAVCTRGEVGPAAGGASGRTLYDEVPLLTALRCHPLVEVLEQAAVEGIDAAGGGLAARLRVRPQPVNAARCTACGKCVSVCPVDVPAAPGAAPRRAVTLPPADLGPQVARIAKLGKAPCRTACPIGVNAQGYVALIAKGRHREALAVVRERNPLPGVCGRVCTHPCEAACRRGELDGPVAICKLKRYASDLELSEKTPFSWPAPAIERDQRVAVVGSGPAGLTAAYELRRLGYRPTIFEARDLPGGLLRAGIPEYRLPRKILDYEIGLFRQFGVEIRTGVRIGEGDVTVERLLGAEGFAAVVLATGAPRDRAPGIPGEDLPGAQGALAFLAEANLRGRRKVGRRVAVVGGGNSAIDAARVALRLGAEQVTIVYRRGEAEMPALAEEIAAARDEGVKLLLLTAPVAVLEKDGKARGLRCVTMALGAPDASGRRRPEPVAGSEHEVAADTIVFAIGQEGDPALLAGAAGVTVAGGRIAVDARQATGRERVFAAGDLVRGPDSVIWSMAEGQRAALAVHAALSGEAVEMPDWTRTDYDRSTERRAALEAAPRHTVPHAALARRTASFVEVEGRFREKDALAEAARCLQCGICCECGACVAACGEARAIDHGGWARTVTLPLLAAVRTDAAEPVPADAAARLAADAASATAGAAAGAADAIRAQVPPAEALLASLREDEHCALLTRRRALPAAEGVRVVLCTCNDSVHHRELVARLAEEAAAVPGVAGATILNAACQPEGARAMASLANDGAARLVLAACLCCPLEILCGSCTHQRARAKENLFGAEGIPPEIVETVNLRDEVLNQAALDAAGALATGRRVLAAGVARALAAGPRAASGSASESASESASAAGRDGTDAFETVPALVSATARRGEDRPAPLTLPGAAVAAAAIAEALCRGCGTCARNCPQQAITLAARPSGIPVARVDAAACTLCGRCLAVCPVGAPDAPFAAHAQVRAALAAALAGAGGGEDE